MAEDISIETGQIREFSTVDYVVFGLFLGLFAAIGVYHAVRDWMNKKDTTEEFVLGGRKMPVFPVALSLTVTFLSALTILGNPAEMYTSNTMYMWLALAAIISMILAGVIFIPFFYELGVTSTFQYLEWRFDISVRLLGSFILILQALIYMAFVLYAPCLAFSAVTGIDIWVCIVSVGAVVTFYTGLGGMKAVLWTDAVQFFVMLAGILAVLIKGSMETGGFAHAWDVADERKRVELADFSFDPTTRHSVWSIVVGGGFFWTYLYGINQAQVQRCLATSSVRNARLAIIVNTPGLALIILVSCFCGIVMFAFYSECDPVKSGIITRYDQLLILFVMDILGHLKGIPGVFVSCVFSGSLSSISSALNAISTLAYEDFLRRFCCQRLSDFTATLLNKFLVVVFGLTAIGFAFIADQLDSVLQGSVAVYGVLSGPLFGMFVLAMFVPWCNKWGALVGTIVSLGLTGWIGIAYYIKKLSTKYKAPLIIHGCAFINSTNTGTVLLNSTTPIPPAAGPPEYEGLESFYTMSYLYYTPFGMAVAVVVGFLVSLITGPTKPSELDPRLICPLFDKLFPCLPEACLRPLRCGVNHKNRYDMSKKSDMNKDVEVKVADPSNVNLEVSGVKDGGGVTNRGYDPEEGRYRHNTRV